MYDQYRMLLSTQCGRQNETTETEIGDGCLKDEVRNLSWFGIQLQGFTLGQVTYTYKRCLSRTGSVVVNLYTPVGKKQSQAYTKHKRRKTDSPGSIVIKSYLDSQDPRVVKEKFASNIIRNHECSIYMSLYLGYLTANVKTKRLIMFWYEYGGEDLFTIVVSKKHLNTLDSVISVCLKICQAVKCLHDHGLVHRDLKPENIVTNNNRVRIVDLEGLCKVRETLPGGELLCQSDDYNRYTKMYSRVHRAKLFSEADDWFAVGITLMFIIGSGSVYTPKELLQQGFSAHVRKLLCEQLNEFAHNPGDMYEGKDKLLLQLVCTLISLDKPNKVHHIVMNVRALIQQLLSV
jgi:serine/threonine protein kinase